MIISSRGWQLAKLCKSCKALTAYRLRESDKHMHGASPCFNIEKLDRTNLGRREHSPKGDERRRDVNERVPTSRKIVFHAAVERGGMLVANILRVGLDVNSHPACGEAWARERRRHALGSIFEEKS